MSPESVAKGFDHNAKSYPNGWKCKCPCHEDKQASLSVGLTPSGGIKFYCFAGCNSKDIYAVAISKGLITPVTKSKPNEIIYKYYDSDNKEVARKIRRFPKDFRIHKVVNGEIIKKLDGYKPPLYNLPQLIKCEIAYITEGEKDADNVAKDLNPNEAATCSIFGGGKWSWDYRDHFKDKIVIICQDNDPTGREDTEKITKSLKSIIKELWLFEPPGVPEKGDVTDWLNSGGKVQNILSLSKLLHKNESQEKKKTATRKDYYELFERVLHGPRKCIFAQKLMSFDEKEQLWNPSINYIDIIKSEALVMNELGTTKFNVSHIQAHLAALELSKEPELLVDIPEWDKEDRISAMAYLFKLKETYPVSLGSISELLKEWCSLMFERLQDPLIQNRILVLQGGQGIGKDTWTNMLVGGLGQFAVPLAVMKEDKDTYLNLHRGLAMMISEFDKTTKTESSTLKDIITTPSTNLRAPYDKDSKLRVSRCSFISSANIEDLLRDHTGNRRFMIIELESIEFAYFQWSKEKKKDWQLQVLAEAKHLASIGYKASETAQREMREYIQDETPTDPAEDLVLEFLAEIKNSVKFSGMDSIPVNDPNIRDLKNDLRRKLGSQSRNLGAILKKKLAVRLKIGGQRVWVYKLPEVQKSDLNGHQKELETEEIPF